ncbi:MAG: hypothetical protein K2X38_23110 [Gemmataceae bacterium]|nr:hypothetical protein [Gemmataceae bacterium]
MNDKHDKEKGAVSEDIAAEEVEAIVGHAVRVRISQGIMANLAVEEVVDAMGRHFPSALNDALRATAAQEGPVVSHFRSRSGQGFLIVTEPMSARTTVLLASEYALTLM